MSIEVIDLGAGLIEVQEGDACIISVSDVGVQGSTGPTGASTFAGLTDLTTASVGSFTPTASAQFNFRATDGANKLSYVKADLDSSEMYSEDASTSAYSEIYLGANGEGYIATDKATATRQFDFTWSYDANGNPLLTQGYATALSSIVYTSAGTTDLLYGRMVHRFAITAPSGNVGIDMANSGDFFIIFNETASTITFEADTTETFNGRSTVSIPTNTAYLFFQHAGQGKYQVQQFGDKFSTITFNLRSGSALTTGFKGMWQAQYNCVILAWSMYEQNGVSTTTVLDVWKGTSADLPLDNGNSITNANEPTITAGVYATDTDLGNWTTTLVSAGDFIGINVDSNDNAVNLDLVFKVVKI